jgi:hypothetical protein
MDDAVSSELNIIIKGELSWKIVSYLLCAYHHIFLIDGSFNQADISKEKYSMNGSVSLGAADDERLDKTKVT